MAKTQNAPERGRFVSGRRVLLIAIAVSLLFHLFMAGYFPWRLPTTQPNVETRIAKVRIVHIERVRPPTPAPPTPSPTPAARASMLPPKVTSTGGPPARRVVTGPVAIRTSSPRASPTPSRSPLPTTAPLGPCGGHSDAEPSVQATPDSVDIPAEARAAKTTGSAQIKVTLDAQGHVTAAAVAQSTGNPGLDAVALELARAATYAPRYVNCKGVAGEFLFSVHFAAL